MNSSFGQWAWLLLQPGNALALALALGLLLRPLGLRRLGFVLATLGFVGMVAGAALPLGVWMLAPLENRFAAPEPLPAKVDGIVVLGGAIQPGLSIARKTPALNGNAERLTVFAELVRRYPEAKAVFTGGPGRREGGPREADIFERLLPALGLEPSRIIFERASRTTHDNAVMAKEIAKPEAGQVWLLVTSARHMPRAVGAFRKAGWTVVPVPADYRTAPTVGFSLGFGLSGGLERMNDAAYEWFALLSYYLAGKTDALFPEP